MFVPVFDSALTPVVQTDGVGFGCKRFLLTSRGHNIRRGQITHVPPCVETRVHLVSCSFTK